MKFLHKYGTRRIEIQRARKEFYLRLSMFGAVLVFFGLMILVTKFSPRLPEGGEADQPDPSLTGDPLTNPRLVLLRDKVETLLARYELAAEDGLTDMEDIKVLEQALKLQQEIIHSRGSEIASKVDTDRLEELQTLHDEEMGRFLIAQSVRREEEAMQAWREGSRESARDLIRKASQIQEEINEYYSRSSNRSQARFQQLQNLFITWQTQPLAEEADRLKQEAYDLSEKGEFQPAIENIQRALAIQRTLNQEHRNSRFATLSRLRAFQDAAEEIEAAPDIAKVEERLQSAAEAMKSGNQQLAIQHAEEAETLQIQLMERLPKRRIEQRSRLEDILILKDTAASLAAFHRITDLREATRQALLKQDLETFKGNVANWRRESQAFARQFSKSKHLDELSIEEAEYLYTHQNQVPSIMELVYNNTIRIPGEPDLFMYATEVQQSLFEAVMDTNPSSTPDAMAPVESVTWEEAREFARRLEWILARPVALPTEKHFLEALGELDPATINATAWNASNSNRQLNATATREPVASGFYDLLGNVAEWLSSETLERPSYVFAIGGSSRDSSTRLATIPRESRSALERNRFVGFRFTVQIID